MAERPSHGPWAVCVRERRDPVDKTARCTSLRCNVSNVHTYGPGPVGERDVHTAVHTVGHAAVCRC